MNPELRHLFTGSWQLDREISDLSTGDILAKASGESVFEPTSAADYSLYTEGGVIQYAPFTEKAYNFRRSFDYRIQDHTVLIYFADGASKSQLYQSYTLDAAGRTLTGISEHLCGQDVYNAVYYIHSEDAFTLETVITGPRKNYRITTKYQRR